MDDILLSRQINFPDIPKDIPDSQKDYFKRLQLIIDEQNRKIFDMFASITDTGATAFTGLSDVPTAYTTAANKLVAVNSGSTGLTFVVNTGTNTFTGLTDTPANYTTAANKLLVVNAGSTAVAFAANTGVNQFINLTDAPAAYTTAASKFVKVNAASNAVEFVAHTLTTAFTQLTDVPQNYTTAANKYVVVNSGSTGLGFVTLSAGGSFYVGNDIRSMTAANGTVDYVGGAFTPKAVFVAAAISASLMSGVVAFGDATNSVGYIHTIDGSSRLVAGNSASEVVIIESTAATGQYGQISAFTSGGFSIIWRKNNTPAAGTMRIGWIAFA